MYGYMYPAYPYPNYYNNNDGFGSGWIWAIIIVLFIIFFLFFGNNNHHCNNNYR